MGKDRIKHFGPCGFETISFGERGARLKEGGFEFLKDQIGRQTFSERLFPPRERRK